MRLAVIVIVLGTSSCFAADSKDDAAQKELAKLQRTWKVLKASKAGEAKSKEELKVAGDVHGKFGTVLLILEREKK